MATKHQSDVTEPEGTCSITSYVSEEVNKDSENKDSENGPIVFFTKLFNSVKNNNKNDNSNMETSNHLKNSSEIEDSKLTDGFEEVKPSKKKKRVLSSDSSDASDYSNRTRESVCTENPFEPLNALVDTGLNDININDATNSTGTDKRQVFQKKFPPVTVDLTADGVNWMLIHKELDLGYKDFLAQRTGNGEKVKVWLDTVTDIRRFVHYLQEHKVDHFCFELEKKKLIRIVIKGLPINVQPDEIKQQLEMRGLSVVDVHQLKKNKMHLPLYLVKLEDREENKAIYQVTNLFSLKIDIIDYINPRRIIQCFRCQGFNHKRNFCSMTPKCVKCGQNHLSEECNPPDNFTPVCANCGGGHPASYRGCPRFPKPWISTASTNNVNKMTDKNTMSNSSQTSSTLNGIRKKSYAEVVSRDGPTRSSTSGVNTGIESQKKDNREITGRKFFNSSYNLPKPIDKLIALITRGIDLICAISMENVFEIILGAIDAWEGADTTTGKILSLIQFSKKAKTMLFNDVN